MQTVADALATAGVAHELAWSAVMCPPGGLRLADVDPLRYTHLVFVCGPLSDEVPVQLHERFAQCRRIDLDVTLIDRDAPAVSGFHAVIARDAPGTTPHRDLAARQSAGGVPVVGVYLTAGQGEYRGRRCHASPLHDHLQWCLSAAGRSAAADARAQGPNAGQEQLRQLVAALSARSIN